MNQRHDIGIASQIGRYSDAVYVPPGAGLLFISGTPGLRPDGTLPPTMAEQADLAWSHVCTMLACAGMDAGDIVKVSQYLLRAEDIGEYAQVRSRHLKDARPASMLSVIPALVRPGFLVEVEVIAAKGR